MGLTPQQWRQKWSVLFWDSLYEELDHIQNELRSIYNDDLLALSVGVDDKTGCMWFNIAWGHTTHGAIGGKMGKRKSFHMTREEIVNFSGTTRQVIIEGLSPEDRGSSATTHSD